MYKCIVIENLYKTKNISKIKEVRNKEIRQLNKLCLRYNKNSFILFPTLFSVKEQCCTKCDSSSYKFSFISDLVIIKMVFNSF